MMNERIHMGTQNVWRWYFAWPVDRYETANWHRLPSVTFKGRWQIDKMAPTRFAGRAYPFLTFTFHKTAWRFGIWPVRWQLDTVLDYIEENGGIVHVQPTPYGLTRSTEDET